MKTILIALISTIFLMTIVSSQETIYAGGCYNLTFPNNESVNFEILEGDLSGFSWTQNNSIITYCLSADFKPQTFRIRWFNDGYQDVVKEVKISSGGGGTRVIERKVEVPKYIDREIEVEKEVIKEVPSSPEIKKEIPKWVWLIFWLLVVIIVIMAIFLYYRNEIKFNPMEMKNETK